MTLEDFSLILLWILAGPAWVTGFFFIVTFIATLGVDRDERQAVIASVSRWLWQGGWKTRESLFISSVVIFFMVFGWILLVGVLDGERAKACAPYRRAANSTTILTTGMWEPSGGVLYLKPVLPMGLERQHP